ncbi:MAG: DUF4097 family beta strand repeat-containing protein [Gemmatimonadota bacterium]
MDATVRRSLHALLAIPLALTAAPAPAAAQVADAGDPDDAWCDRAWAGDDRVHWCEVRELPLPAPGDLAVDADPNGGIHVEAWDRDEILVRARVLTHADDEGDARALARRIRIESDGRVRAEGPDLDRGRDRGWSVSYRVFVPRRTNLDLEATNGGLDVVAVEGRLRLRTLNGGITLDGVAGDVRGRTTNGGLRVHLAGDRWRGDGLDLATTNGGVRLAVPEPYSARLVTGTVNGPLRLDFPIFVQGRIDRTIETTLGDGGATIHVATTNGSVVVERS